MSLVLWDSPDTPAAKAIKDVGLTWAAKVGGRSFRNMQVPFPTYIAGVTTRARSGSLGDLVVLIPGAFHEKIWPALTTFKRSDFGELSQALSGWEVATRDASNPDEVIGMPLGGQGQLWYYNKELFERVGLDPASPPSSWEEFEGACRKLKAGGTTPIILSAADNATVGWAWTTLMVQMLSPDEVQAFRRGEIRFTDARFQRSIEPLETMFREGWVNASATETTFGDAISGFGSGKAAMAPGLVSGNAYWGEFDKTLGKDGYGVFVLPPAPGGTYRVPFSTDVLIGMYSRTKNPDAAMSLLQYMGSKEARILHYKESGEFPNRADVKIEGLAGSPGADAVAKLIRTVPNNVVPLFYFTSDSTTYFYKQAGVALANQKGREFLSALDQQQRGR